MVKYSFTATNAKINFNLFYELCYKHCWDYPVSNNWLKVHNYNMRRKLVKGKSYG